jgi:hypothetical protein
VPGALPLRAAGTGGMVLATGRGGAIAFIGEAPAMPA